MKFKKIGSAVLAAAMVAVMLPMTMISAFAAEGTTASASVNSIMLGTSHLNGAQVSKLYLGTYQQSDLGSTAPLTGTEGVDWVKKVNATNNSQGPYYSIDPIQWRVLSNADGKLFLLSDSVLEQLKYHNTDEAVTWETCTLRSWLNGYASTFNQSGVDYTDNNFIGTAFSAQERLGVLTAELENADNSSHATEGGNNTEDKVFLLSEAEALNSAYGFTANKSKTETRVTTATAYVTGISGSNTSPYWWLRSPGLNSTYAALVLGDGSVSAGNSVTDQRYTVRPACYFNASSVLFTSAAEGGKPESFSATAAYSGDAWKLTLLDTSRSAFSAELLKTATQTLVSWSGATTGSNEYISAIIKDAAGNVTYYGRLKNVANSSDASGDVAIDLSDKLGSTDTLYIFNEQYNGDYRSDYASALKEVTLPTGVISYPVTFYTNGGTINSGNFARYDTGTAKTLPTDVTKAYCTFGGWYESADCSGSAVTEISATDFGNKVYYAKWELDTGAISTLEGTVRDLQTTVSDLQTMVRDLQTTVSDLQTMVRDLQTALSSTDTDLDDVNEKIAAINRILGALDETYATDADVAAKIAAVKQELEAANRDVIAAAETLVQNAQAELQEAIDSKADTETVNGAIKKLQSAINILKAAKDNSSETDSALKSELESKIENAQTALTEAYTKELAEVESSLTGVSILAIAIGSTALVSNAAWIATTLFKKKKKI